MNLEDLLHQCTVKLFVPGQMGWGTGFFVAPGLILTCAHVVKNLVAPDRVRVWWQGQEDFVHAELVDRIAEVDLALLQFKSNRTDLPCVYLDERLEPGQELYFFGYPGDFENGCPVTGSSEGLTGDMPPLIKFKQAQVQPGMSGSALLNRQTGKVCGMVTFTRDRSTDLGGGAVSTRTILEQFPHIKKLQEDFHKHDRRWTIFLANLGQGENLDVIKNGYYTNLQTLLDLGDLKEADRVTAKIMLFATGLEESEGFDENSIMRVPDSDLLKLDSIWSTYNPKFGFRVQKLILFERAAGKIKDFAKLVGWRDKSLGELFSWKEQDEIIFNVNAPDGHLPWAWANLRNKVGWTTGGSQKRLTIILSNKKL